MERRGFLQQLGAGVFAPAVRTPAAGASGAEQLGFKPHQSGRETAGRMGAAPGRIPVPTSSRREIRDAVRPRSDGQRRSDSGSSWHDGTSQKSAEAEKPVVAFSRDHGDTWTPFQRVEGAGGRPMALTYLGKGNLTFHSDLLKEVTQFYSGDYGRTWPKAGRCNWPRTAKPSTPKATCSLTAARMEWQAGWPWPAIITPRE